MWETAKIKEYEVYLFYPARVENVLTKKMVTKNIKYKLSEDFRDNIPPKSQTYKYKGMGDESSDKVFNGKIPKNKQGSGYVWDRNKILDANRENLRRIADYCREQGIELNLRCV